jgi:hypothetical protein
MMTLNNDRTKECINFFKKNAYDVLDPDGRFNFWIAGGSIKDYFFKTKIKDFDLFFPNQFEMEKMLNHFKDRNEVKFEVDKVANIVIKGRVYQIVKKNFFQDPIDTISNFDFTVCCGAVDRENFYCDDNYFIDLASKKLMVNNLTFPVDSIRRMQKYIKKGFSICNNQISEIAIAVSRLELHKENKDINGNVVQNANLTFYRVD